MNVTQLTPIPNDRFNPFLSVGTRSEDSGAYYKIYNDGGHYLATPLVRGRKKNARHKYLHDDIDILFDSLYAAAMQDGLKSNELTAYIKSGILLLFPDYPDLDGYVADKIERKLRNLYARKKRARIIQGVA